MNKIWKSINKELKILKHAAVNHYNVCSEYVDGTQVIFSVDEKNFSEMKTFCQESFDSFEIIEQHGSIVMCKVEN